MLEVFGHTASGKTALAASFVREAYLADLSCGWVSIAGHPETKWLQACGAGDCLVSYPTTCEMGIEAVLSLLNNGASLVVIEGLTQAEPVLEARLHLGTSVLNSRNRMLFHGCHHIARRAKELGALVIVTSEVRIKPGFGPVSSMRNIFRRSDCTRLQTRRLKMRTAYGKFGYLQVEFKVLRSGTQPPGALASGLVTTKGFNRNFELLTELINQGVLQKAGAYWTNKTHGSFGPGYTEAAVKVGEMYGALKGEYDESRSNRRH